jgi:hypothetical protein
VTILGDWILRQIHAASIAQLKAMPVADLKALWDRYPSDGSSLVDGHDLDDVHLVLNLLGHGDYCAV